MATLRLLLVAGLTAFCVSCSSEPTPEGTGIDLPAPPPPVFPSFRHEPPAAPARPPRDPETDAVWHARETPPKAVAPPADPPLDPSHEEIRPAAAQQPVPRHDERLASIDAAAATLERKLALEPSSRETRRQLVHLYLANGDWERADSHMAMMPATTFEDRLLAACVAWRIGGPENRTALRMLSEAQHELSDVLPFEIRTASFCERNISKVGQFQPLEKAEFMPGEKACLYLSFDDFTLEEVGGQYRVLLGFDYRIVDRGGNVIPWNESANDRREFTEAYRERVRDLCVPLLLSWPKYIGTNDYVLEVTVTDRVGRKSATKRLDFRIR